MVTSMFQGGGFSSGVQGWMKKEEGECWWIERGESIFKDGSEASNNRNSNSARRTHE